jgi:hypothetical protein
MRRLRVSIICVIVFVTQAQSQVFDSPLLKAEMNGVLVNVWSDPHRVIFCFSAAKDVKIASGYGIEFKSPANQKLYWDERLPKVVTKDGNYFSLPLRVELRTRNAIEKRHISIDLGACSEQTCNPIDFELDIPQAISESRSPGKC